MTWCDKIHADDILHKMDEIDLEEHSSIRTEMKASFNKFIKFLIY